MSGRSTSLTFRRILPSEDKTEMASMEVKMQPARKRKASKSPGAKRRKISKSPALQKGTKTEKKWVDINTTDLTFNSTGLLGLTNGLVKGTDSYQRIARRVRLVSIQIRGQVYQSQVGTTPLKDNLRLIIFYDREANGAAPAAADLLQCTNNAGTTETNAYSHMNLNNSDRFAILKEFVWATPTASGAAGAIAAQQLGDYSNNIHFKWFKKLDLDTKFNAGNAGTVADITTGSLYVLALGMQANADAQYNVRYTTRLRFTDA